MKVYFWILQNVKNGVDVCPIKRKIPYLEGWFWRVKFRFQIKANSLDRLKIFSWSVVKPPSMVSRFQVCHDIQRWRQKSHSSATNLSLNNCKKIWGYMHESKTSGVSTQRTPHIFPFIHEICVLMTQLIARTLHRHRRAQCWSLVQAVFRSKNCKDHIVHFKLCSIV